MADTVHASGKSPGRAVHRQHFNLKGEQQVRAWPFQQQGDRLVFLELILMTIWTGVAPGSHLPLQSIFVPGWACVSNLCPWTTQRSFSRTKTLASAVEGMQNVPRPNARAQGT